MIDALDDDNGPEHGPDILIVDDNPLNLELLAARLGDRTYHVRMAEGGRKALALAHAQVPDVVMLDISMPQMDGYEVCRQLKADPRTRDVPIIFVSALDEVVDKVKAFDVGGSDYVSKPFEFGEVLVRLENQIKLSRLQKAMVRRNEELRRINAELLRAQERENRMFTTLSDVLPGTVLDGRYQLEEKIGAGGFGAVFRARQLALDRTVAVKVLHPLRSSKQGTELEHFLKEGVSACRVNHPNALAIYDSGITAGVAYIVMELLQGRTLAEEIKERKVLTPARAKAVAVPVCRVLAEAHAVGVIHRDIKPGNIFLHRVRDEEIVKLVDFGVAKLVRGDTDETASQSLLVGTPHYFAPERLRGSGGDGRADVYSVGVTLYRMLAGVLPIPGESLSDWLSAVANPTFCPEPLGQVNPRVPAAVADLVMRTLARDPDLRPSAGELGDLLEAMPV